MKNKVKRNLILALTIGGIATIPNFVFANTAVNTPGTVTDLVNGVAIGSNSVTQKELEFLLVRMLKQNSQLVQLL